MHQRNFTGYFFVNLKKKEWKYKYEAFLKFAFKIN